MSPYCPVSHCEARRVPQAYWGTFARRGSSAAIGKHRGVSNPTGLHCHMHGNDAGLVRCNFVLSGWQRKLEAEGAELGLFDRDATISVDDDLYGMRWCSRVARTFSRHSQQHAETRTRSLGRCRGGSATHDDKCTGGDTKSCSPLPHFGHLAPLSASSYVPYDASSRRLVRLSRTSEVPLSRCGFRRSGAPFCTCGPDDSEARRGCVQVVAGVNGWWPQSLARSYRTTGHDSSTITPPVPSSIWNPAGVTL